MLYIFIEYFYEVYTFDMKTLNGLLLNLNLHYLFEFRLAWNHLNKYASSCNISISLFWHCIIFFLNKKSLSTYIRKYQAKNARTEDLWNVLSEVSGEPVDIMMHNWTKSTGYPVIHVQLTDNILEFKQVLWSCNQN